MTFSRPLQRTHLSPHAIQRLSSLLDSSGPGDVGLSDASKEDDRGRGPFEIQSFNVHILLPYFSVVPLHDHLGMTVLSEVLYVSLHVKAYERLEPAHIQKIEGTHHSTVRLAKVAVYKVLTAACNTSVLYSSRGGNLQCFTASTPCANIAGPAIGNDNHPIILGSIEDMVRLRRLCETNHSGAPTLRLGWKNLLLSELINRSFCI
ncbi:hypothetical protein Pfo_011426 [Paulownia fortunei]|nr:hypothetical protein Pfo_011426 [Paulownia fortunei]